MTNFYSSREQIAKQKGWEPQAAAVMGLPLGHRCGEPAHALAKLLNISRSLRQGSPAAALGLLHNELPTCSCDCSYGVAYMSSQSASAHLTQGLFKHA